MVVGVAVGLGPRPEQDGTNDGNLLSRVEEPPSVQTLPGTFQTVEIGKGPLKTGLQSSVTESNHVVSVTPETSSKHSAN